MRLNRTFSRRIGKSLSKIQKELLQVKLPQHIFNAELFPTLLKDKKIILEIGFGMGEHFIHQASRNPQNLYIGVEVYLNGVANVLKLANEKNIFNFLIWPDDLDLMLKLLPERILEGIYILFPDPWPKRKQFKKRIFNLQRLEIFKNKLNKNGFLVFASDIEDYFNASYNLIAKSNSFKITNDNFLLPYETYIATKYHQKAQLEGRIAKFLCCMLK